MVARPLVLLNGQAWEARQRVHSAWIEWSGRGEDRFCSRAIATSSRARGTQEAIRASTLGFSGARRRGAWAALSDNPEFCS
jgi:hypothetical protein